MMAGDEVSSSGWAVRRVQMAGSCANNYMLDIFRKLIYGSKTHLKAGEDWKVMNVLARD